MFFERPGSLRVDVEDGQTAKFTIRWTEQRTSRDEVTGFMEVGEMRHVGVLKRCGGNFVEDGSIRPQHQKGDRELIESHGAIVGGLPEGTLAALWVSSFLRSSFNGSSSPAEGLGERINSLVELIILNQNRRQEADHRSSSW